MGTEEPFRPAHRAELAHVPNQRNAFERRTHSNTHQQTSNEELFPCLSACAGDRGNNDKNRGDEDCSSSTKVIVARVGDPAAEERRTKVWTGVDDSNEPAVTQMMGSVRIAAVANAEFLREAQVGSVGTVKGQKRSTLESNILRSTRFGPIPGPLLQWNTE